MADIVAASASQANVQTAVNSASDGDRVLIPNGSATWASGISTSKQIIIQAQNLTPTPNGATSRNVTILNNSSTPLFALESGNTYNVGVGGIRFNEGTVASNHIYLEGTGSKVPLIFDCYFECDDRFGNMPSAAIIAIQSQGGLLWNCYFQALNGAAGTSGSSLWHAPPRAWDTASTLGALDDGTQNVYMEDCTAVNCSQFPDVDSRGRFVVRHCDFIGTWSVIHGLTSGLIPGRHTEYYNNSITNPDGENRGLSGRSCFMRGGTAVWTDNYIDLPNSQTWGDPKIVDIGEHDPPNTYGSYPIPKQPGWGHNGTTNVIDPIYIWNNTGSDASSWATIGGWDTHVQLNRDIYVDAGAKPGYSKYTYPHPQRSVVEESPPIIVDVVATRGGRGLPYSGWNYDEWKRKSEKESVFLKDIADIYDRTHK